MKDGSDPLEVDCTPPINIDWDITWSFKRISCYLKDQSVDSEGAKSKDTIKMDEPVAQRTRHKIKQQHLSEPRKDTILLDKMDTEMRELLIRLIAQKKKTERPDQGDELDAEHQ
jgi:hypothetical protein